MIYEPAFPDPKRAGMSLRDYFAAQALAALIAGRTIDDPRQLAALALDAYQLADALLEARKQKPVNDCGTDEDWRPHVTNHHEGSNDAYGRRPGVRSAPPGRHPSDRVYPRDDRDDLHQKHYPLPGGSKGSVGADSPSGETSL